MGGGGGGRAEEERENNKMGRDQLGFLFTPSVSRSLGEALNTYYVKQILSNALWPKYGYKI